MEVDCRNRPHRPSNAAIRWQHGTARAHSGNSSGRVGAGGVAQGDRLLTKRRWTRRDGRHVTCRTAVRELLQSEQWQPRNLRQCSSVGDRGVTPGLRVGIVSAKVLAYATGCALVAVDTFAAIAAQAPPGPDGPGSASRCAGQRAARQGLRATLRGWRAAPRRSPFKQSRIGCTCRNRPRGVTRARAWRYCAMDCRWRAGWSRTRLGIRGLKVLLRLGLKRLSPRRTRRSVRPGTALLAA